MKTSLPQQKKLPKGVRFHPVSFSDLPGWRKDDHKAAFLAFRRSCEKIMSSQVRVAGLGEKSKFKAMSRACLELQKFKKMPERNAARRFFETHFQPHKIVVSRKGVRSLLTGYYEPILQGSRVRTKRFYVPIYKKPADLISLSREDRKNKNLKGLTMGRKTARGIRPYYTREEIDKGRLKGKGVELLYLDDEVDAFFLQIQGSGRIRFKNGTHARVNFAARNGYPYSSIGRYMLAKGLVKRSNASLASMKKYLRANIKKRRKILWQNKSYIFFRELNNYKSKDGPMGAMGVPLTSGRSLAVDTRYHQLGTPIYVVSPKLKSHRKNGFRRLMVAQDVGSAIKGPQRGDIYWGSGKKAGQIAGRTKSAGQFFVLLPKR